MASFQKPISAELVQQLFGEIRFPYRDTAGGDEYIGLFIGADKGRAQLGRIVGDDAKVEAVAAHARQHGPHAIAVGVIDIAVGERGTDRFELIAGAEDGHFQRAAHRDGSYAKGGQQWYLSWGEASAGWQHAGALADIAAGAADILARFGLCQKSDPIAVGLRFFLHHHCIGACGYRGAGHDPHAVASGPFALIGLTGKRFARHDERGAAGEIRKAHGVTVHSGVVEGGHGEGRGDVAGKNPAKGLWQGLLLAVAAAGELFQHPLQGIA